jgi:hypothetical protein
MNNSFFIGVVSWFLPGVGHLFLGRWKRGLILGAVIWAMFVIAVFSGGLY